ncbi:MULTISPECIES: response regulator [Paenibacillus]|uniref:Response regulator transcription factor n=1 Tax=Paenibacillus radicis (ex Xue et al. 2023) TaxID=2972489 RepID=A0ABT1YDP5_9BACL|nr:response regulator transcription factor [Paenibacillus radicis (ex Xue et al. 2023)]MCR8631323.1 response regulator transcription factor [Paenibacillus radicis (ex Xue et al. 2023)]
MIRVLIVDDMALMRDGLQTILGLEEDFQVVGTARSGEDALEQALLLEPDIVLMDIQMPGMGGIAAIRAMREKGVKAVVLILTTFSDIDYIVDGLSSGAAGFLMKDMPGDQLIQSIREAVHGNFMLPSVVARKLAERISALDSSHLPGINAIRKKAESALLSERERGVARLLLEGRTNREIAGLMFMSEGTVKNYVSSIYSKIGTNDRTLAIAALRDLLKN